jgi:hypothetical protein
VDFDFEGFSGQHLSDYTTLHQLPHVSHTSFQVPSIIVIRDMSLAAKLSYEDPILIKYVRGGEREQERGGEIKKREKRSRKNEETLAHIFSSAQNNRDS